MARSSPTRRWWRRLLPVSFAEIADCRRSTDRRTGPVRGGQYRLVARRAGDPHRAGRLNVADFEIPDNRGHLATDEPVQGNGAPAKMATLPVRAIEQALLDAGIPARLSSTAGTYLCNACLYSFLTAAETMRERAACGFIHVPYLPSQVAELQRSLRREAILEAHQRADMASMDLATGIRAVETAIESPSGTAGRIAGSRRPWPAKSSWSSTGSASASDGRSPPTSSSLTVNRREFFTFLGPSGSGKSTILRMVAGLVAPDAGRIIIDGQDVAKVPPWRRNLGMMFQQYAVFPHMNVAENIGYGLKVRGERRERHRPAGRRDDRAGRSCRAGREERHPSQRRRAAARGARPRAGAVAAHAASRRAAFGSRREDPAYHAGGAFRRAQKGRNHLPLRHARPGGSADHEQPDRRGE